MGNSTSRQSYSVYQPLNPAEEEIRLLEIVSIHPQVICKLSTVSLLEQPPFTALSYVWGDPDVTTDIILEGVPTSVTTNLAYAIHHVHQYWKVAFPDRDLSTCRIWADAICINQKDVNERNQQVKLMRGIYWSSELVFSWLGPEDTRTCAALTTIDVLADEITSNDTGNGEVELSWMEKYPEIPTRSCA